MLVSNLATLLLLMSFLTFYPSVWPFTIKCIYVIYSCIHVCCPSLPLTFDFTELNFFNLMQVETVPTHSKGHTLDLVLSFGLSLDSVLTNDICVSDHKAILFDIVLTPRSSNSVLPYYCHIFNSVAW